jgi:hypothetical protein
MNEVMMVVPFGVGVLFGFAAAILIALKDRSLINLKDDEVVIKKPNPELILVQVTPEVARRLVNTGGDLEAKSPSEARALYPERSMAERQKQFQPD